MVLNRKRRPQSVLLEGWKAQSENKDRTVEIGPQNCRFSEDSGFSVESLLTRGSDSTTSTWVRKGKNTWLIKDMIENSQILMNI